MLRLKIGDLKRKLHMLKQQTSNFDVLRNEARARARARARVRARTPAKRVGGSRLVSARRARGSRAPAA